MERPGGAARGSSEAASSVRETVRRPGSGGTEPKVFQRTAYSLQQQQRTVTSSLPTHYSPVVQPPSVEQEAAHQHQQRPRQAAEAQHHRHGLLRTPRSRSWTLGRHAHTAGDHQLASVKCAETFPAAPPHHPALPPGTRHPAPWHPGTAAFRNNQYPHRDRGLTLATDQCSLLVLRLVQI